MFFIACNKNCFRCESYVIPAEEDKDETLFSENDNDSKKLRVKLLSNKAIKPKKVDNGYDIYRCVMNQQTH
jgi:hypothetical protein